MPEQKLPKNTQDEGGIHKERELQPEQEQKRTTKGEPQSEADRDRKSGGTDTPASTPRH